MAQRLFPWIVKGAWLSFDLITAPISDNGSIILFIGRFERLSSPIKVEVKELPARIPLTKRIVVPEFPQSKGFIGQDRTPFDLTIRVFSPS